MRHLPVILLFLFIFISCRQSMAGVVVKRKLHADTSTVIQQIPELGNQKSLAENQHEFISFYKHERNTPARNNYGWEGIASLACAAVALVMLIAGPYGVLLGILLSICSIIFGILGLGKDKTRRGLAIAGLAVGIIAFLVLLFTLAVLIALSQLV